MNGIIMAAQLILGLAILVLVHEFGHYIAARIFKIRVDKFFIFFDAGFKIWSKKIGDTEFGIGWLPFGGYCKIAGMIDESLDKEQMKQPPQPWEFRSKPAWQRLIVMLAGVIMNVILGILIFTMSHLVFTKEYLPAENVKDGIFAYEQARFIGFKTGDHIVAINGKEVERAEDILSTRFYFGGEITVKRNNDFVVVDVPDTLYKYISRGNPFIGFDNFPLNIDSVNDTLNAWKAGLRNGDKLVSLDNIPVSSYGNFKEILFKHRGDTLDFEIDRAGSSMFLCIPVDSMGKIGVYARMPEYQTKKYTVFTAFKYAYSDAFEAIYSNIKGYKMIFTGVEKPKDIAGPIGIAKVYGAEWNWARFWYITGLLSMVLAFLNILPIPALDGGHALFLVIEAVTRRKFSDRFIEIVQYIGLAILLVLMVFLLGNDIVNLFR
ncbi:MAG: RIP metalloprotease RseP [Bacteroidales bacterium]|nr:RIP metalloprotease RseP [Bacteroidales bacterium]HOY39340.1 RIP metalloprotease RseP [Bacteroidales bacterium]HQP02984.1 RIP metalloprotease RseP [Bacteroidales bacterium]